MHPIITVWRPPTLSELTPMIINMGLTHLDSEGSISQVKDIKLYYNSHIKHFQYFHTNIVIKKQ